MSRGLGHVERHVLGKIRRAKAASHPRPVALDSWTLACELFQPSAGLYREGWRPTKTQQQSVVRAMHLTCRKHPEYALAGGKGRKRLYLYEPADPVSTMWAKMVVERPGGFVPTREAHSAATASAR